VQKRKENLDHREYQKGWGKSRVTGAWQRTGGRPRCGAGSGEISRIEEAGSQLQKKERKKPVFDGLPPNTSLLKERILDQEKVRRARFKKTGILFKKNNKKRPNRAGSWGM